MDKCKFEVWVMFWYSGHTKTWPSFLTHSVSIRVKTEKQNQERACTCVRARVCACRDLLQVVGLCGRGGWQGTSEVVGMAAGKGTLGLLGQQLWPVPSLPSSGKPQLCSEDTQLIG